ncbi:putative gustatory receptor 59f [Musca vetustissima]|uniref:putative gustatory receptor 59f n=1 Tax=Musca vetustissima TaxID=27455 RepID=UPI002AB74F78|nr:putative gustatory receptor 59f [Musca vetustissima]
MYSYGSKFQSEAKKFNSTLADYENDDLKRQYLEKQLYRTMEYLMVISQFFICAPVGVEKPRKLIETNKDRFLYYLHFLWCAGMYCGLVVCVYDEYTSSNIELPTIQKPLYFSEYLVYLIHLMEILLRIFRRRDVYWKFNNFMLDFDRILWRHKIHVSYVKGLQGFIRMHLLLIATHLMTTLIVGYFYSFGIWLNFLRTSTVYLIPNIIIHISLVQYYALLYLTAERSDWLYYLLNQLLQKSHNSKNHLDFRRDLHFIRSLYAKLEEFTRDVNDYFCYSIILVYVGSFINISINIFLLYKYLSNWENSNLAWTLYSVVWTCMHIGKMSLILYYNEEIQSRKTKASYLLSTYQYGNAALEPTFRHFILQLMSDTRSNVICGMLALNLNFVTSLLISISTLFIFLVQYDITYEALTKTFNSAKPSIA